MRASKEYVMDFNLSGEQIFFRGQSARTIEGVVAPSAIMIDQEDVSPYEIFKEIKGWDYYGVRYP